MSAHLASRGHPLDPTLAPRPSRSALLLVGVIAVILRVGSALLQGDTIDTLPGVYDQVSYDSLARRVLEGHGFSFAVGWWPATHAGEPTAHWSFLYTLYLAGVYQLFGGHILAARLIQAILTGLLQTWLTWRLGSRLFGAAAGLAGAAIAAVYPYFVYYAGSLVTETVTILALLWVFDLATGAQRSLCQASMDARWLRAWLLIGLAFGCAALLRQVTLVAVPLTLVWLVWAAGRAELGLLSPHRKSALAGALIAVIVMCTLILPWTIRNYAAFGRFVLLNTNAGYVFFWANHPVHGSRFVPIFTDDTYARTIPPELRGLDEAAIEAELMRRGVGFVRDDPGRYVLLSLSRIEEYFKFWPVGSSSRTSNLARVLSFGLWLPFMLYGLFLAVSRRRCIRPGHAPSVVLLVSFMAMYATVHLLSWALIRYRLPIDAFLVLFAGLAVADLLTRVPGRQLRATAVLARSREAAAPRADVGHSICLGKAGLG